MLKFLCIGDIHIQPKNFQDVDILLKQLENHLIEMKEKKTSYDYIVVMGDTLHNHRRIDSICLTKATEYFLMLEKYSPVYIICGNHDMCGNYVNLEDKHWLNPFKTSKHRFIVVDDVIDNTINGHRVVFMPYVPDGMFHKGLCEKLGNDYYKVNKPKIIFGHQMFNGVCLGGLDKFMTAEDWIYDIQIVSGHIHNKQTIPIPKSKKTIYYTGSSLQHMFGETEDKTVASIILNKDDIKIEEIRFNLPIRRIIKCNIDNINKELNNLDFDKIKSGMLKIKCSIKGNSDEYKSFIKTKLYRDYEKLGIKFDFKGEFKNELLKQISEIEKNKKQEGLNLKELKYIDFFNLLDLNIKKTNDLIDIHEKLKQKLPIRHNNNV